MGLLYRKYCENCDSQQKVTFDGFAGAVISDNVSSGEVLSEWYLAYLKFNNELIVLPHPVEESTLNSRCGTSMNKATLKGRILSITNLICCSCGTINTTASLKTGTSHGCITGLVLALIMIAVNIWVLDLYWGIEYMLVWLALLAPLLLCGFLGDFYINRRYSQNAMPFKFQNCKNCGSSDAIPLHAAKSRKFMCPKCGEQSVTITIAGRS